MGKKFIVSWLAVFVTFSLYGWLVWGQLLAETLDIDMGRVWRAEGEEMLSWIFIAYALMAYVMVRIFSHDYQGSGMGEGLRFGLLTGVLFASATLIAYAVQPMTMTGALTGFGADVVMFVVAGLVLSKVYGAISD